MDKAGRGGARGHSLLSIYESLNNHFGDLKWWPAESPLEVIIGAILTQNTAWGNVEKAIANLKKEGLITPGKLKDVPQGELEELIRPAGYFRIKTARIKAFINFLFQEYQGDLGIMLAQSARPLRDKLLKINGIGEETADSILLYAGGKPVFVVDAYTRRIFERHDIVPPGASYSKIQAFCMENLREDPNLYNQFHALLVNTGKYFCKKQPACLNCPLA